MPQSYVGQNHRAVRGSLLEWEVHLPPGSYTDWTFQYAITKEDGTELTPPPQTHALRAGDTLVLRAPAQVTRSLYTEQNHVYRYEVTAHEPVVDGETVVLASGRLVLVQELPPYYRPLGAGVGQRTTVVTFSDTGEGWVAHVSGQPDFEYKDSQPTFHYDNTNNNLTITYPDGHVETLTLTVPPPIPAPLEVLDTSSEDRGYEETVEYGAETFVWPQIINSWEDIPSTNYLSLDQASVPFPLAGVSPVFDQATGKTLLPGGSRVNLYTGANIQEPPIEGYAYLEPLAIFDDETELWLGFDETLPAYVALWVDGGNITSFYTLLTEPLGNSTPQRSPFAKKIVGQEVHLFIGNKHFTLNRTNYTQEDTVFQFNSAFAQSAMLGNSPDVEEFIVAGTRNEVNGAVWQVRVAPMSKVNDTANIQNYSIYPNFGNIAGVFAVDTQAIMVLGVSGACEFYDWTGSAWQLAASTPDATPSVTDWTWFDYNEPYYVDSNSNLKVFSRVSGVITFKIAGWRNFNAAHGVPSVVTANPDIQGKSFFAYNGTDALAFQWIPSQVQWRKVDELLEQTESKEVNICSLWVNIGLTQWIQDLRVSGDESNLYLTWRYGIRGHKEAQVSLGSTSQAALIPPWPRNEVVNTDSLSQLYSLNGVRLMGLDFSKERYTHICNNIAKYMVNGAGVNNWMRFNFLDADGNKVGYLTLNTTSLDYGSIEYVEILPDGTYEVTTVYSPIMIPTGDHWGPTRVTVGQAVASIEVESSPNLGRGFTAQSLDFAKLFVIGSPAQMAELLADYVGLAIPFWTVTRDKSGLNWEFNAAGNPANYLTAFSVTPAGTDQSPFDGKSYNVAWEQARQAQAVQVRVPYALTDAELTSPAANQYKFTFDKSDNTQVELDLSLPNSVKDVIANSSMGKGGTQLQITFNDDNYVFVNIPYNNDVDTLEKIAETPILTTLHVRKDMDAPTGGYDIAINHPLAVASVAVTERSYAGFDIGGISNITATDTLGVATPFNIDPYSSEIVIKTTDCTITDTSSNLYYSIYSASTAALASGIKVMQDVVISPDQLYRLFNANSTRTGAAVQVKYRWYLDFTNASVTTGWIYPTAFFVENLLVLTLSNGVSILGFARPVAGQGVVSRMGNSEYYVWGDFSQTTWTNRSAWSRVSDGALYAWPNPATEYNVKVRNTSTLAIYAFSPSPHMSTERLRYMTSPAVTTQFIGTSTTGGGTLDTDHAITSQHIGTWVNPDGTEVYARVKAHADPVDSLPTSTVWPCALPTLISVHGDYGDPKRYFAEIDVIYETQRT